jgi:hypothetical protein
LSGNKTFSLLNLPRFQPLRFPPETTYDEATKALQTAMEKL